MQVFLRHSRRNVAIVGNPWGNGSPGPVGSKGCPATSLGLGGAGGRVAPPVENNADSFLNSISPRTLSLSSAFLSIIPFYQTNLAWDSFGEKNGTPDFLAFKAKIMKYRSKNGKTEMDSGPGGLELQSSKGKVIIWIRQWAGVLCNAWVMRIKNLFVYHSSRQGTSPTPLHLSGQRV